MSSTRDNGLWKITRYLLDSSGSFSKDAELSFVINPQSVTHSLVQRVAYKETLGGFSIMPWVSKECHSGYPRLDIKFSGVSKVFIRDSGVKGVSKNRKLGIVGSLLGEQATGQISTATRKINDSTSSVTNLLNNFGAANSALPSYSSQYMKGQQTKDNILRLYGIINAPFVNNDDNEGSYQAKWNLTYNTPFFSSSGVYYLPQKNGQVATSVLLNKLSIDGYITSPMSISEKADDPFLPSWEVTFSIFNADVKEFMKSVAKFPSISSAAGRSVASGVGGGAK